jgi:hypothetical protein
MCSTTTQILMIRTIAATNQCNSPADPPKSQQTPDTPPNPMILLSKTQIAQEFATIAEIITVMDLAHLQIQILLHPKEIVITNTRGTHINTNTTSTA